jgi:hypothetical protein
MPTHTPCANSICRYVVHKARHEDAKQLKDTPNHECDSEEACVLEILVSMCLAKIEGLRPGKSSAPLVASASEHYHDKGVAPGKSKELLFLRQHTIGSISKARKTHCESSAERS